MYTAGTVPEDLVGAIVERLVARGATIAVAESCTGGLICAALCAPAGASRYLLGGVVAYANSLKTGLLGVPAGVLAEHGAVSAEAALAMARAMKAAAGSDLALGVTGLAGPQTGRRSAKAAGTVYVALAGGPRGDQVREHEWSGSRQENQQASTVAALRLLYDELSLP
jgi:nicotinamide-nucleotide amidase